LFGQVIQLPGQRFNLLPLFPLDAFEVLLHLPKLLLQLLDLARVLGRGRARFQAKAAPKQGQPNNC
jgi:hypothetical protein